MRILHGDMLVVFQLFGVLPVKYNTSASGNSSLVYSPKLYKWSFVVIIFQLLMTCTLLSWDIIGHFKGHPVRMQNTMDVIVLTASYIVNNIYLITCFISISSKLDKLIDVYTYLEKLKSILKSNHSNFKTRIIFQLSLVYTIILYIMTLKLDILKNNQHLNLLYLPFSFQYCTVIPVLCTQFNHVCQTIIMLFKAINSNIDQEVNRQSCKMLIKDLEGYLSSVKFIEKGNLSPVTRLRTLTDLYWLLCEAVHQANAFYSAQLLAAIFSSFVHIIITLYYFFLHIWPTVDQQQAPYLVMQIFWIITHISHLVLLVWPSTAVTDAANETAPMICKLINRELDPAMRKHMETFLLQLLHHNAKFSALGFFQIHSHILTSIAGSVTTYLVILIQFQTSSSGSNITPQSSDLSSNTAVCSENPTNI